MHPFARILPLVVALTAMACGPKVEAPFEGQGAYEGKYEDGRSPEGWRESGMEEGPQTARAEEGRSPEGWRDGALEEGPQTARAEPTQPEAPSPRPSARPEAPAQPAPAPMARRQPGVSDGGAPPQGPSGFGAPEPRGTDGFGAPGPRGTDGFGTPGERGTDGPNGQPTAAVSVQEAVGALRSDAADVRGSTDLRHRDVVAALRHLAGGLSALSRSEAVRTDATQIYTLADQLAASEVSSMQHADWTREALQRGADALTSIAAEGDFTDVVEPQMRELRAQIDLLQDGRGLLEQTGAAADALGQFAGALEAFEAQLRPPAGTR